MFAYTVPRHQNDTSSKPSPSRNTEVIIFTFGSRIAFILKKFRISVLKPHPSKTVYFRSLKSSFSFPLQFLINYLHIPFFLTFNESNQKPMPFRCALLCKDVDTTFPKGGLGDAATQSCHMLHGLSAPGGSRGRGCSPGCLPSKPAAA